MFSLVSISIFFPLLTFLFISIFGRKIGIYGSMVIACVNMFNTLLASIYLFFIYSFNLNYFISLWDWVQINSFVIPFSLRYDGLTGIMFLVVSVVSTCVHIYSCVYMYTDPFLSRFLSYLSLFTFFMLLLVSSGNFLVLFMG